MTGVRPLPQTRAELAAMIDHTLLSPGATEDEVRRHCGEALELGVFAHAPAVKAAEAELAWREGARELEVVMNLAHALAAPGSG